jgi:predicted DsbA family dithiol-disulfide isomerase
VFSGGDTVQNKLKIQIWSEIECPWCWVGKRRLESALARVPFRQHVEIIYRAFRLMPGVPVQPVEQVFANKYGRTVDTASAFANMEKVAAAEGLAYHLAGALAGDTLDAHRLVAYAKTKGLQDEVLETLYKAHFTDHLSIFDRRTLVLLASQTGLDSTSVETMLACNDFVREVEEDEQAGRALGVRGVPHFLMGGRLSLSGGQPVENFVAALHQVWNDTQRPVAQQADGLVCGPGECAVIKSEDALTPATN